MKLQRSLLFLTLIACIAASAFLIADAFVRDQALMLAAFASLAISGVSAILKMNDPWTNVSWGKFFVAIVYASIAVVCLVAMAHTADAIRFAHAVHAVL